MVGIHERTGRERISSSKVRERGREGGKGGEEGGREGGADFGALHMGLRDARNKNGQFLPNQSIDPSLPPSLPPFPPRTRRWPIS